MKNGARKMCDILAFPMIATSELGTLAVANYSEEAKAASGETEEVLLERAKRLIGKLSKLPYGWTPDPNSKVSYGIVSFRRVSY
jgi:hypothetical protein